jgi:hypothetical protein
VEKDTLWIKVTMNAGILRIILERGSFVANATNLPDVAKKILSIQKTAVRGRFVKSVGESTKAVTGA